jgi:zinc protease
MFTPSGGPPVPSAPRQTISLALIVAFAAGCLAPAPPGAGPDAPGTPARYAQAPRPPAPVPASHPAIVHVVLPSGLLIVLEQDIHATAAGVVAVVRGGSSADPQGKEGVAHLVEHLTYRAVDGTAEAALPLAAAPPKPSRETRWEKLIRYAATGTNAFTSPDSISFFEFGPPTRLRWLLDVEAARLAAPLAGVDDGAVALERQVIASENELRDDPRLGAWATRQLFPLLFPASHPYARPISGTAESRARLTLADARAYAAENFHPERMTLLVTAPTATITLAAIAEHLPPALVGDVKHPVKRPSADEADDAGASEVPQAAVIRRPSILPSPQIWIGWTLPGDYGKHAATLALLSRWIHEDLNLDQLRQEETHIRSLDSRLLPGAKASVILVHALLEEGADPERVAQVIGARVSSLWTRATAQHAQLERLKATIATELELDEPPQGVRAYDQALIAALGPAPALRANLLGKAVAIPDADLAQFAYQHLKEAGAHAVMFTPAPTAKGEPAHRTPPSPAAASAAALEAAAALDDTFTAAASWDPMELPGTPVPIRDIVTRKLPMGLTVIVARLHTTATTALLAFRGGYADANPPLLVEMALRTRPDAFNAPKFHILSGRGATHDASIESLEFQPAQLGPALRLLFMKATAPVQNWPPQDGLERMLAPLAADQDPASLKAHAAFARALFGDHPYGRTVSKADLSKVTRSDVEAWVGRVHNLRNAALVVVGDVDPDNVASYAMSFSSHMKTPDWVEPLPEMPGPILRPAGGENATAIVTGREGALVDVSVGCLLPRATAADRPYYRLLRLAVQERLNNALRVQRGEGYGVDVGVDDLRGGTSYLFASTFLDVDELVAPLTTIHSNWQRWGREGFDAGEVNVARWRYAGEIPLEYASGGAVAYRLFSNWKVDPATVNLQGLRVDIVGLSNARLNELFATCKANTVVGLTGDEPAIRRALAKAWPGTKHEEATASAP